MPSLATLVAAVFAPLLVVALFAEHRHLEVIPCIALAAIAWTIVELARPMTSPLVAMLPATIAAVLEPGAIVLVAIAGTRVVTAPSHDNWRRPKWAIAVPIVGGLAVMLALTAGFATNGACAALGVRWFGNAPHPAAGTELAYAVGDALGPLVAVAALAGVAIVAKLRLAEVALVGCAVGATLVDLRAGTVGSTTLGVAALCAGIAIGRFASTIRMPRLQALAGATAAMLLLVPPAWTVIEHVR